MVPAWFKGTSLLTVTLAAGVAIGIGYERRTAPREAVEMDAHDAMHHLTRDLHLDPGQETAIAQVLARHQREVDSTWHAVQPHVRTTLDSTEREIIAVLRPDQVVKYRQMVDGMPRARH